MLRSHVSRRLQDAEPVVLIYLPMLKEYISGDVLTPENEQELKRAVKKAGGMVNTGGLFLKTTSQTTKVTSKVGVNRRSVMQVPRSKVPPEPLKVLDKCKCIKTLILCIHNFIFCMTLQYVTTVTRIAAHKLLIRMIEVSLIMSHFVLG